MIFAALTFDRDPLKLADLPAGLIQWFQSAGGFATAGLVLFLIAGLPRWRAQDRAAIPGWLSTSFLVAACISLLGYVGWVVTLLAGLSAEPSPTGKTSLDVPNVLLAVAGLAAIIAVAVPFLRNLIQLRFRRIYALAKLSFKEAIRRRVLYAFSGMLLVFLFASWFVPSMPKDQVRTYVGVVFLAMSSLLLFTAALLTSFSIPADIRQQTIHTIVTKPVERFEI